MNNLYILSLFFLLSSCGQQLDNTNTIYFIYLNPTPHYIEYNFNPFKKDRHRNSTISVKPFDSLFVEIASYEVPDRYEEICFPLDRDFKSMFVLDNGFPHVIKYDNSRCDTFTNSNKMSFRITDFKSYKCKKLDKYTKAYYYKYSEDDFEKAKPCK